MFGKTLPGAFLSLALAAACSSPPTDPGDGVAPTPIPETSVYDSCMDFAARLCADQESCCQQAYDDFDQTGCLENLGRRVCRPGADREKEGRATFNEDAIEPCLAARAHAHAICVPTWAETLELRKEIYTACRVIDGTTALGGGCSSASDCKRPEGAATVTCFNRLCTVIEILAEGAACPFPSGDVSVCGTGLACDAAGLEQTGTCVKATATGQSCDNGMLEGTECGLGSYCDRETATCQVAINRGGAGCAQSTECVSFECDRLAESCQAAPAVVSRDECLGAATTP